ncbi:MAG TPA: hypothetical protein VF787_19550 [Thermoanaerobaculia bacterium]
MVRSLFVALALFAGTLFAGETVIPTTSPSVSAIAVGSDDTVWFASERVVGRIKSDGSLQTVEVQDPLVYFSTNAVMQPLPGGGVLIGASNGVIVKVSATLNVALFKRADLDDRALAFIPARDGTYWLAGRHALAQIDTNGVVLQERKLPFTAQGAVGVNDGTVFLGASDGVYRGSVAGNFQLIAPCQYCNFSWMAAMSDGTIAFEGGRLLHDGTIVSQPYYANAAVTGPDGRLWVAGWFNTLRALRTDGSQQEIPVGTAGQDVVAIATSKDALWYAVGGEIRRITPDVQRDLPFRDGDILTREDEPNLSIDGMHPVFTHRRRGSASFTRRLLWNPVGDVYAMQGNVFAASASRVLAAWSGSVVAKVVNESGNVAAAITMTLPQGSTKAFALDRNDTMYALRSTPNGFRILTIDAQGTLQRNDALPVDAQLNVRAVDLAADQCTLFYAATRVIGRMNVCRGIALPDFAASLTDSPLDVRATRDGEVIVAYRSKIVRYDRFGIEQQVLHAPPRTGQFTTVALDPDARFVWIGTDTDVRRVEWSTGATIESHAVYGPPASISIIGEPRAARGPAGRRRSAGH